MNHKSPFGIEGVRNQIDNAILELQGKSKHDGYSKNPFRKFTVEELEQIKPVVDDIISIINKLKRKNKLNKLKVYYYKNELKRMHYQ